MQCRIPDLLKEIFGGASGILGGSFDPIHNAHISQALEIRRALSLRRVILIPVAQSPYKNGHIASAEDRLKMVSIAVCGHGGLEVKSTEINRDGPSYTIDTIERFGPERQPVLIVGADAFSTITTWHRYKDLLGMVDIAVVNRPGSPPCNPQKFVPDFAWFSYSNNTGLPKGVRIWENDKGHYVVLLPTAQSDLSSTKIRSDIETGELKEGMIPNRVREYIEKNNLYTKEHQ